MKWRQASSVLCNIYSIIALTTCSICTIWNVQLSYSCFVIFVNSMSMSFNLWDNYWSCLFYPDLTHLCNFECNIGTKHLALLWTENWTSTVCCGWAFCMFRIIRKHVDCEVVNGNIPASCWFRIHIAKGGPSASGRDLPPVTGRSRVRVVVSSHCTSEGKALTPFPRPRTERELSALGTPFFFVWVISACSVPPQNFKKCYSTYHIECLRLVHGALNVDEKN